MNWKVVNQKYVLELPENLTKALKTACDLASSMGCLVYIRDDAQHGIVVTMQPGPRRGSHLIGVVTRDRQAVWVVSELENRGAKYERSKSHQPASYAAA